MGFYGNVSNITRSTFQFDRIYGSRYEMERALESGDDDVYIGRYVLIEYDQDVDFEVFTRIFPRVVQVEGKSQTWFYTIEYKEDITSDENLVHGVNGRYYYTAIDDVSASSSQLKNVVLYKCVKDGAYILGASTANATDDHIGFIAVEEIDENGNEVTNYTKHYNFDRRYGNGRGYDGTVWMKTYVGDNIKYVMIAELNSVIPTFAVSVDAPSEVPNQPHFDTDSTNVYYDLHVQPTWGFRIKKAENPKLSDVSVEHNYTYYNLAGNKVEGKGIINVDGDIYYNAKGFNVGQSIHDKNTIDTIKLTEGSSEASIYNQHNTTDLATAKDIKELSIRLPSIGNAVADLYDVLYGQERNTVVSWDYQGYNNKGLRLSRFLTKTDEQNDTTVEKYEYNPEQMGTVAASINTLHDFIGMIIDNKSYKSSNYISEDDTNEQLKEELAQRKQQFIDTSDENTIYYDTTTNKYFRKTVGYDYLNDVKYSEPYIDAEVTADNYQPNIYFVIDEKGNYIPDLPDINGEYPIPNDGKYYKRVAINDQYYDEVNLTNYKSNQYYSLINGVYTKSTKNTFDEALNYYDISNRGASIDFDDQYIIDDAKKHYYQRTEVKDASSKVVGLRYDEYNKIAYDEATNDQKVLIDSKLSTVKILENNEENLKKQLDVVFYEPTAWFYRVEGKENDPATENGGYYLATSFDAKRTYYIFKEVQKTSVLADVDGTVKEVDIYIPLPGSAKTIIDPNEYYIVDIREAKQEQEAGIFHYFKQETQGSLVNFVSVKPIETTIIPMGDNKYSFTYGDNDTLKGIKYVEFDDDRRLYVKNHYYSEYENIFKLDTEDLNTAKKYYLFNPDQTISVHNNNDKYFYKPFSGDDGVSKIGYYFEKDENNNYQILTNNSIIEKQQSEDGTETPIVYYKLSNNDLYVMADTNHVYDKYTVWNSNASIVPCSITLNRRKEKYVFEELKEFGIQYNTLLGILLEARRVLSTSLDTPEETRDTSTVQGCINKLNDIFAYLDNRYPGQFLITDAYDRIVNAPITTAQIDTITNIGTTTTTTITTPMENRWIEVNINSDPVNPQIKYQHNFNPLSEEDNTTTNANKNKQLEVGGKTEDTRGNGLNKTTGDVLSLYTPIVDGMGHVVGKNTETVVLPYGYKTFTTNGAVDGENDFYSTINEVEGGANTTDITVSGVNQSMASNTQDIIAIEPFNKWIQTKIENDKINIAHSIHSVDTTENTETDINDNGDTITLQDMVFDKAGHIIENHPHTYTLPYGFKKVKVVNSAGASNTEGLSTTATTTVIADNTQDQFSIETGNRWIRMRAVDGADNKITIQHEIHKQDTHNGEAKIDLTTADTPKTFDIKSYSFDEAGHVDGTITTTVSMPTNYGIFTDGKTATTTAQGTQSTMTVKGDEIHLLPTIGTDTIMFTHIGPDTTTVNTTTTLASNTVGGKPFASFGDSFTIANVSYDKQGHINGTSTFDIKIPEIMPTTKNARDGSNADVITTITINSKTGEIDATRDSVSNLKLAGFTATVTTSLTAEPIKNEDDVKTAFNKVESRLNGAENRLDTLQGEGEGSVAKVVADASTTLNASITKIDDKVNIINGNEATEGSIAYAISALSASIETNYVKKTDYDAKIEALQNEIDALKALVEQYHPTSTDPGEETGS